MLNKSYFEELMYGRAQSFLWGPILKVLSWGYGAAIYIRRTLYAIQLFKPKGLTCPVVSIGNLTLGGTGKTPTVISIGALLQKNKKHPVVISRGYGRKQEAATLVVSDGRSVLVDSQTGGDEPVLIGSKLFGVPVVVGKNRFDAAMDALRRFKPDVVVLDDGFQHVQLKRTLDIVLVDASDPFGNEKLFPAGILREPLSALKRAHAVLITKGDQAADMAQLKHFIGKHALARIFTSRFIPLNILDCCSGEIRPLSSLRGSRILALSGIARPSSFTALLSELGASVAAESTYPDHYAFRKSDLADLYKKARDIKADSIITTEKDAVRLKQLKPEGIYALSIELSVDEREEWESFILGALQR